MRSGDVRAYNSLMDSAFGKAIQTNDIDVTSDGEMINIPIIQFKKTDE